MTLTLRRLVQARPNPLKPAPRTADHTPGASARSADPGRCVLRLVACPSCHLQYDVTAVTVATFACACGTPVDNVVGAGRDAQARRCGACGASVEGAARECPYCRAGLVADATRRRLICPECFTRNDEAYRFCAHCGVEFRPRAVPGAARAMPCPVCAVPLEAQGIGSVPVCECKRCAGLWVPREHFDALVRRAMEMARANPTRGLAAVARPTTARIEGAVRYRDCPDCGQAMHRKNFGRRSGIIVDWCREHGTWLDAEELEGVAAFVMSGALEQAEREHSAAAAAEAAAAAARAARPEDREAWILAQATLAGAGPAGRADGRMTGGGALVAAFLRELLRH